MVIRLKPGVRLLGLAPQLVLALHAAAGVYEVTGKAKEMVVTSCSDGKHSPTSLHYVGHAVDLRTSNLPPERVQKVTNRLREVLGDEFDVVLEADHIHVEWQPKG